MNKTFRISFSLKNTYRANSILYGLKQIPLIKRLLPDTLYRVRGLKIFANVVSALWEIAAAFLGKFLYFLILWAAASGLYGERAAAPVFLHIFVILTVIGSFVNTYLFNPTRDKYYALILLGMDAREYTLIHYWYAVLKLLAGFLLFGLFFGLGKGLSVWMCVLCALSGAGIKIFSAALSLARFRRTGKPVNENMLGRFQWILLFVLLAAAFGLPAAGLLIPETICAVFMVLCTASGLISIRYVQRFDRYQEMCRGLLYQMLHQMDQIPQMVRQQSEKVISSDLGIQSSKQGFEYLNELFIKRHQKILWKSSKRIAAVCACILAAVTGLLYLRPEIKETVNRLLLTFLPYFVFIMYSINRGTGFTRVLFMNCDHSLLTYSFYKRPRFILKLFRIRLREIVKINLLPASVIGAGLTLLLFVSGGTDNPVHYLVLFVSILFMSIFFSVHYLTIYYLLQPYNAGTEVKSGTYALILWGTYLVCFLLMQVRLPTLLFGILTILFCGIYSAAACILVYRLAPRTFKLRP